MSRQYKKERNIGIVLLLILAGLLLIRCFFSFCQTDESFYAALIHRFWQGEKLIQDEWHRAQFYAPLLLPYYGVYFLIRGSSEGAILFLRILYIVFALATSMKLFSYVMKKTSDVVCAWIMAAITILFSRANISGVSYYNLCMLCIVSAFCSIENASDSSHKRSVLYLCWGGALLACAVLCNPFLAPFVLIIMIASLANRKRKRESIYVTIGIIGMAVIYCMYLLIVTGIHGVLTFLPYVLENSEQNAVLDNLLSMLKQAARYSKYVGIPAILMSIAVITGIADDIRSRFLFLTYILVQTVLLAVSAIHTFSEINGIILLVLTIVAVPFWIDARKTKRSVAARQLFLIGIINAFAFSAASNTGLDAGTVGFCISGIGGIWLIRETLSRIGVHETREKTRKSKFLFFVTKVKFSLIIISIVVLTPLLCQRVIGVYRDAPLWMLNTKLEQGPAKGLYTTESHAKQYESICGSLKELSSSIPEGRILYSKNLPWAYLMTAYEYGCCSPWRVYTQELETYYSVRPENRADFICILNERVGNWEKSPLQSNPAKENPNAFSYEGDFWVTVRSCPILTESEWLCIYDVRELME